MTLPKISKITLDGIDITNYVISWKVEKKYNKNITPAEIVMNKNVRNVVTLTESAAGMPVTIQRGVSSATEYYVFRGSVEKSDITGGFLKLICKDRLQEVIYSQVIYSYDIDVDDEAGIISDIFKDLINRFTPLFADNNSVQSTGSTFKLNKFIANNESVYKKCEELAKSLDWQFYYKPSDNAVYFEPKGYTNSGITLTVGTNVVRVPKWQYDSTQLFNIVKLYGSEYEVETTESGQVGVTSGWTTSEVPLTYTPVSVKIFADAGTPPTTLLTGGVSGSTSGTFHYTVDKDEKKIKWETSAVSASDYVEVRYSFMRQIPIQARSSESITAYRLERPITLYNSQLFNQADTEEFARRKVQKNKDPFVYTKLRVIDVANLEVGQTVRVIDSINGEDRNLLVNTVVMKYPYTFDEVEVGDKIPRTSDWFINTMDRIENLEVKNQREDDILNHLEDFNPAPIAEMRYFQGKLKDITGNIVGIWDHTTMGIWDTAIWGGVISGTTDSNKRMIQGNLTYRELLYDTTFRDSTNTTGTWDTGNRVITSGNNQVTQSEIIHFNDVAVNRINFNKTRAKNSGSIKVVIDIDTKPNGVDDLLIYEGYGVT